MPLTLTIRNATQLDNGSPLSLILDRRGGMIGRAATCDWSLPDPALHISSRHCEIRYLDGVYQLLDHSTNGTFLFGQSARLDASHTIGQGDVFMIGRFEVEARLDDAAASTAAERNASPQMAQWQGWQGASGAAPAPATDAGWGGTPQGWATPSEAPAAPPPAQGWGAAPVDPGGGASQGWGTPVAAPSGGAWPPPPSAMPEDKPSTWEGAISKPAPASGWSSAIAAPPPATGDDIWGKFAESNVVDWARGGFGSAAPAPPPPAPVAQFASHAIEPPRMAPVPSAPPPPMTAPQMAAPVPAAAAPAPVATALPQGDALAALAAAAGMDRAQLNRSDAEVMAAAGDLLRRLVAGLVVMLEARARAKSQLGAQGTSLEFDGNNPLKFARSPEMALVQLLNPQERGFMASERAVEDAFKDLQAHQMATLIAMQGALRATLDRFSPEAIRKRAETGGLMSRIMPGSKNAALWAAYEKEFSGVAKGSDEAFMDIFAKEFRTAYEEVSHRK